MSNPLATSEATIGLVLEPSSSVEPQASGAKGKSKEEPFEPSADDSESSRIRKASNSMASLLDVPLFPLSPADPSIQLDPPSSRKSFEQEAESRYRNKGSSENASPPWTSSPTSLFSSSPSPPSRCYGRQRTDRSSLGTSAEFDFFGPSSVNSGSTAATSTYLGSPRKEASRPRTASPEAGNSSLNHQKQGFPSASQHRSKPEEPSISTGPSSRRKDVNEPWKARGEESMPPRSGHESTAFLESPEPSDTEEGRLDQPNGVTPSGRVGSGKPTQLGLDENRDALQDGSDRLVVAESPFRFPGTSIQARSSSSSKSNPPPQLRRGHSRSDSAPQLDVVRGGFAREVDSDNIASRNRLQSTVSQDAERDSSRRGRPLTSDVTSISSGSTGKTSFLSDLRRRSRFTLRSVPSSPLASRPSSRAGSSVFQSFQGLSLSTGSPHVAGTMTPNRFGSSRNRFAGSATVRKISEKLLKRKDDESVPRDRPDVDHVQAERVANDSQAHPSAPCEGHQIQVKSEGQVVGSVRVSTPAPRPSLLRAGYSTTCPSVMITAAGALAYRDLPSRKKNYLSLLPRELIIRCLELLVLSHVEDHRDGIENGSWRGRKASETRYVGLQAGIRELARLSRVCREWQNYVFDGQLWQTLDAGSFPEITESALVRIARASGPFVKRLDLRGLSRLSSSILFAIVDAHSTPSAKEDPTGDDRPHLGQGATLSSDRCLTSLIELDLESCSSVSSECLNQVLSRSPNLKKICLRNLTSVTNETCRILGRRAPGIEYIDVSRCPNVDGSGLLQLSPAKQARHDQTPEEALFSPLKELHAVALKGADAEFMASLGPAFPSLEVLDLSYSSDLTDRAIAAFTSIRGDISQEMGAFVELSSQQAGFDGQEPIYRRVFRLRKLAFSSCSHLTDRACTYLAHSVPYLEVLELANLGPHLRDQGLVRLLSTTPSIARLDLEGATEIRDNLISSLTPAGGSDQRVNSESSRAGAHNLFWRSRRSLSPVPNPRRFNRRAFAAASCSSPYASDQPGSKLTHLIISSASHVSAAALLLLVQHCPSLVHLEADDTPAGDQLAREFVKLSRQRKAREAYLSLIDCRGLTRGTCSELNSSSAVRPRDGKRGYEFQRFLYDDAEEAGVTSTSAGGFAGGLDECNPSRVILKSFWGWQNVDNRLRAIRKAEMKAGKRRKSGGNGVQGGGSGEDGDRHESLRPVRWGRIASGLLMTGDEEDDPRGCVIA